MRSQKLLLAAVFLFVNFGLLNIVNAEEIPGLHPEHNFPGRIEGTGIYFEIKNSKYLNISLQSDEKIKILLESVPKTISLHIEASTSTDSTILTIKGLEPNKTYYKFQDSYKNKVLFVSDNQGSYQWSQDLTQFHYIWLQSEDDGTVFLPEECSAYGIWDEGTKICTLTQNLAESVEIAADNTSLNCDGYSVNGAGIGYGIYLFEKENTTIKNCNINGFSKGIFLWSSKKNNLINNNVKGNEEIGIKLFYYSSQNNLIKNEVSNNYFGGLEIEYLSENNNLIENNVANNELGIFIGQSGSNILKGNTLFGNDHNFYVAGASLSDFTQQIETDNTVEGKPIYYWVNQENQEIPIDAGFVGVVNSRNITIKNLTLERNGTGILLAYSNNSRIENTDILHNNSGIFMYSSDNNEIINNNISDSETGIYLYFSDNNVFTDNNLSQNYWGGLLIFSSTNKVYHNNFIKNYRQVYIYGGFSNLFNLPLPAGGNYWDSFDIPAEGCNDTDFNSICDSPYYFYGGQDNFPWTKQDGWKVPLNQPPTIVNFGQFKSDKATLIPESSTTTESSFYDAKTGVVAFKATVNDPDNDQIKLQVELKEFNQPFNGQNLLESNLAVSGSEITIARPFLFEQRYHWRARAIDDKGNISPWQEFGTPGNVDFIVKLVPLYTQVESDYPSATSTKSWSSKPYANGIASTTCGLTIGQCGCVITSEVMLMRFYGITTDADGNDVNPLVYNAWLTSYDGYSSAGDINWEKIMDYTKDQFGVPRLFYAGPIKYKDTTYLDGQLAGLSPTILYTKVLNAKNQLVDHFILADGKLSATYTIKDPVYYNTRYLNQTASSSAYDYDNNFLGLRVFTNVAVLPDSISATLASPGELLFTDPQGRRLGKDPIAGISYSEIPNGVYYQEGIGNPLGNAALPTEGSKRIWIPDPTDGQYDIKVIGTGSGLYHLDILAYDNNAQSKYITQTGNILPDVIQDFELNYSTSSAEQTKFQRIVNIDIKPSSDPNSINCKNQKELIPVAILSTNIFDAATVDPDTVRFGPNGAQEFHRDKNGKAKKHPEDVNNDGKPDLVLHFQFSDTGIKCNDTQTTLTGKTYDAFDIIGSDSIRTVQNGKQLFVAKLLAIIYGALSSIF